jgi:hypothetical protein
MKALFKPCPKCGCGEDELILDERQGYKNNRRIRCGKCEYKGPWAIYPRVAWNDINRKEAAPCRE